MDKIKKYLASLSPEKRRRVIFGTMGVLACIMAVFVYMGKSTDNIPTESRSNKDRKEISLDNRDLEKSAVMEARKDIINMQAQMKQLEQQKEQGIGLVTGEKGVAPGSPTSIAMLPAAAGKSGMPAAVIPPGNVPAKQTPGPAPATAQTKPAAVVQGAQKNNAQASAIPPIPPAPPSGNTMRMGVPPSPGIGTTYEAPEELIGGIEVTSNKQDSKNVAKDKDAAELEKKKNVTYLPPSFMAATLISGLDAPTVESQKGHPVPVMIRIKDLAFLPNRVRADLKGCFLIAEGTGNLADERAHLRLVNISCLSKQGKSVIDSKIKGFVVDTDGKIGLRGTVVSKMGSVIARSIMAGFLTGIGDALKASSMTQYVSALGTTSSIDPSQIAKAGIGGGIYQASKDLSKFYLDLAKQTMPVVEIGAVIDITVVFSEGVELPIKTVNLSGKLLGRNR
ncbi:MAG: hypothetical protein CSYNP_04003 [Syntrophus sp. SKADARSKE-3]|nr:hypothetical protein [Syntrophus sp. SKADARSKE-3]